MGNYFTPFSLRVDEELLEKIKDIAKSNKRSTNKEIEFILEKYIKENEKRPSR
jgi:hypothetical protein